MNVVRLPGRETLFIKSKSNRQNMFKNYRLTSAVFLVLLSFGLKAQTQLKTGTVTSKQNGQPLAGVTVAVKGTGSAVTTDSAGIFSINVLPEQVLVFSFVGYHKKEVSASLPALNVELSIADSSLSEVVVTAFGIKKEKK
jgi:hypothetical protein